MKNKIFSATTFVICSICASGTVFSLALPRNHYNSETFSEFVENAEKHKTYVGPIFQTDANGKSSWHGTGTLGQIGDATFGMTAAHCVDGSKEGYIEIQGKRYAYTDKTLFMHPGYEKGSGATIGATSSDFAFFLVDPKNISPELRLPQIKAMRKGDVGQTEQMELSGYGQTGVITKKGLEMASVRNTVDIPVQKAGKKEMSLVYDKVAERQYASLSDEQKKQMKEAGLTPLPYHFRSALNRANYNKPGACTPTTGDSGAPYFDENGHVRGVASWGTGAHFTRYFKNEKTVCAAAPIPEDVVAWMARTAASSQGHKFTAEDLRKALESANQEPALSSAQGPDKINIPAGQAVVVR